MSSRLITEILKIKIFRRIILPVLQLREECKLWVFENSFPRQIFGPKSDANLEWRRLHNEELHSLYRSSNIVRVIKPGRLRWASHVARMKEGRSTFKILTRNPTGKRSLARPRHIWEDNIRKEFEEIGINAGNWVDSAQYMDYWRALVNVALNLRVL